MTVTPCQLPDNVPLALLDAGQLVLDDEIAQLSGLSLWCIVCAWRNLSASGGVAGGN